MSKQSVDGTDREGIGMLYAGGAGIMIGTSVAYGSEPALGWVAGSVVMALGLAYEVHQRYVHTATGRSGGADDGDA